jgi:alpha-amylase
VGNFLISGIPTIYYGLEQEMAYGLSDPDNRDALWKYNGYSTETGAYKLIKKMNEIRKGLSESGDKKWHETEAKVGQVQNDDIVLERDGVVMVLTSVSSRGACRICHIGRPLTCSEGLQVLVLGRSRVNFSRLKRMSSSESRS